VIHSSVRSSHFRIFMNSLALSRFLVRTLILYLTFFFTMHASVEGPISYPEAPLEVTPPIFGVGQGTLDAVLSSGQPADVAEVIGVGFGEATGSMSDSEFEGSLKGGGTGGPKENSSYIKGGLGSVMNFNGDGAASNSATDWGRADLGHAETPFDDYLEVTGRRRSRYNRGVAGNRDTTTTKGTRRK
jgi:hypothetical protein